MVKVLLGVCLVLIGSMVAKAETGKASVYWSGERGGNRGSTGERLSNGAFTAAHKSRAIGSHVTVTNLSNGRFVMVRINDRGPYAKGRIIDLRKAPANSIGCNSLCNVRIN